MGLSVMVQSLTKSLTGGNWRDHWIMNSGLGPRLGGIKTARVQPISPSHRGVFWFPVHSSIPITGDLSSQTVSGSSSNQSVGRIVVLHQVRVTLMKGWGGVVLWFENVKILLRFRTLNTPSLCTLRSSSTSNCATSPLNHQGALMCTRSILNQPATCIHNILYMFSIK